MSDIVKLTCLRPDGLWYGVHDIQQINETTLKCWWCKKYFKEVDVNGRIVKNEKN